MIRIGITMGDPAGIGPEIILKTLAGDFPAAQCDPVVIGCGEILARTARLLKIPVKIVPVNENAMPVRSGNEIPVIEPKDTPDLSQIKIGQIQEQAGKAARLFIDTAVSLIQKNHLDCLCTAPIHKEAMRLAGFEFPGHTEYLAHLAETREFAMLMAGGGLRVVLLTIHTALKNIHRMITKELILNKLRLTNRFIPYFGVREPRIGVCGLNPHAGEGGLFGDEEEEIIIPAIEQAKREGISAEGPFSADTIFHRMLKGDFDAILAMYHDQALIPIKTLAFYEGVNITMGLPFIRTSVDHGTGFDIAGKGMANPSSLKAAIRLAVILEKNKKALEDKNILHTNHANLSSED